jgi:hypothetical protein
MGEHALDALNETIDAEDRVARFLAGQLDVDVETEMEIQEMIANKPVVQQFSTNVRKTAALLAGFDTFYCKRGFLSDKQKAIIESNYKGGVARFIEKINNREGTIL